MNSLLLTSNEYGHTSTFAFMFYQTTHVTVCVSTHITHVAAVTKMYAFTSHQTSLITVYLFTYIRHKNAHHYVRVGVLSDGPFH